VGKNFTVGQANEILSGGKIYDLHNHYDFGGITIASNGCASVWFTANGEHGKGLPPVTLDMEGIDFLAMSSGVAMGRVRDLDEVGYKQASDQDLNWLLPEQAASDDDHLVLSFGPSDFLRIHAASMRLREGAPAPFT